MRLFGWENGGIVTQAFKLTIAGSTAGMGTQKVLGFPLAMHEIPKWGGRLSGDLTDRTS